MHTYEQLIRSSKSEAYVLTVEGSGLIADKMYIACEEGLKSVNLKRVDKIGEMKEANKSLFDKNLIAFLNYKICSELLKGFEKVIRKSLFELFDNLTKLDGISIILYQYYKGSSELLKNDGHNVAYLIRCIMHNL